MSALAAVEYRTERGLVYNDLGDKKLRMTMYVPEDEGAALRPGMVLIHGGGWILGTRYQQAWYCRQFARNGYVVMTIDYRLMPKYAFPDCLHDCKSAVRWLRLNAEKYRIDPDRIVTFGASAGGHLAALLATTLPKHGLEGEGNLGTSSEVRAAVSLYGAVDLTLYRDRPIHGTMSKTTSNFFKEFTTRNMGHMDGAALEAASPLTYVGPDSKPMLFVHGTKDRLVHYEQSVRFRDRLDACGVEARIITIDGKGHGFDYIHWKKRRAAFDQMVEFLDRQTANPTPGVE